MSREYELRDFSGSDHAAIEDALEAGEVVYFARCPIDLPTERELEWLRCGLDARLKAKNLSYDPESDSIPRF